jgi:organic radical activating enzyme
MDFDEAKRIIWEFSSLGTKAVTITGGGEPLCHPRCADMIREFHAHGIEVGLVTNGLALGGFDRDALSLVTWCRISNSDYRTMTPAYMDTLESVTTVPIDWAFSHVVGAKPNLQEIGRVVDFANAHNFTHVRLVSDLMNIVDANFDGIRESLTGRDARVIYQPRKEFVAETSCLIGYIKPVVAADFRMYLCCGVQYAIKGHEGDMPDALCMGTARYLSSVYGRAKRPFRVPCDRCYYRDYNVVLKALTADLEHEAFL